MIELGQAFPNFSLPNQDGKGDLDSHLDFRLISCFAGRGGNDHGPVVFGGLLNRCGGWPVHTGMARSRRP